jgi:CRISPR-associated protein Csd1
VFPALDRNFKNHLTKLYRGRGLARWVKDPKGLAYALELDAGKILLNFNESFPRQLPTDDQGMFVIGYYHQKFARRADEIGRGQSTEHTVSIADGDEG